MRNSHQCWLLEKLPPWEWDGLLTADGAHILRERHVVDTSQPGLAQIVTGSLGAMRIGTGLIAMIGYHWDAFSRLGMEANAFSTSKGTMRGLELA